MRMTVTNGDKSATFDRAQFGFNTDGSLHVEVHRGGDPACPEESSPTPELTFIVTTPRPVDVAPIDRDAGATASFLDWNGDISDEFPPPPNTELSLTPVAAQFSEASTLFVAFDVRAVFEQGALVEGHGYATHCVGMDE